MNISWKYIYTFHSYIHLSESLDYCRFPVGLRDNETRIAVVKIGEEVTNEDFTLFSQSTNGIAVKSSIIRLQGNEDQTNTAASLTKVLEIFKAEGRDQQTYPHLVLVATDGKSENTFQTKRYASILKLNGKKLFLWKKDFFVVDLSKFIKDERNKQYQLFPYHAMTRISIPCFHKYFHSMLS